MSTLGKVLAVFNLLIILAAFFYFFPTDWGTRQSWAHSYFRHGLVLDGLPLDDQEKDTEGHIQKDKLSEAELKQMFQGAGTQVSTQMAEVKSVRDKLQGESADRLKEILSTTVRTAAERDEILATPAGKLQPEAITRIFEEVDRARDPGALRSAIAHVLFNCYEKDDKEKRMLVVVGLKQFASEVNQEAETLMEMAAQVRRDMQRDLSAFEAHYPQLVKDIQLLAEKIEDAKKQLAFQDELSKSHNSLVMKRTQDVAELKKAIFDARLATKQAMDNLTNEQKLYHKAEAEAGERAKQNQDLEREIRQREHVEKEK
jgi:hypothetical protein